MSKKIAGNSSFSIKRQIFDFLKDEHDATKQEILVNLNISMPTINTYTKELLNEGVIIPHREVKFTGGRNATAYAINSDCVYAIGIDITRLHITTVIVNLSGEVIDVKRIRYPFSKNDAYVENLGQCVSNIVKDNNIDTSKILGVGIGLPALTNEYNDLIVYGEILDITGLGIEDFEQFIPYDVMLFNDANAAGFAETWTYNYSDSVFYLMLSNNVGGSMFIDGDVYYGNTLKSGEVGHLKLHRNGNQCYCGQKGCVDTYCSATALIMNTEYTLEEFFQDGQGQKKYPELWDQYLDELAVTINNVRMFYDSSVVIGGYVGSYIDEYIEDIKERVSALNSFHDNSDYITSCLYKNQSIAAGSALKFINYFIERF